MERKKMKAFCCCFCSACDANCVWFLVLWLLLFSMSALKLSPELDSFITWVIVIYLLVSYAVVTLLHKAASYEPRIAILGIWGDTWLTRGKYGIYVAVGGSYGVCVTPSGKWREMSKCSKFCHVNSAVSTVVSPTWQ